MPYRRINADYIIECVKNYGRLINEQWKSCGGGVSPGAITSAQSRMSKDPNHMPTNMSKTAVKKMRPRRAALKVSG